MAELRLGPEELDRLEDALEGLEFLEDTSDPSEAVASRLLDFKTILQASREALPLEPVRPGLLDSVLSEARMSAPDIVSPSVQVPAKQSLWQRIRKSLVLPGLAVAGSAALVLLIVKPKLGSPEAQPDGSIVARSEPAASAPTKDADAEAAALPESDPASEPPAEEQVEVRRAAEAPPPPAAVTPPQPSEIAGGRAPADDAANADEKVSSEGWDAVEDGDAARKGGDCFSARNHYARALDDGNDSVRARAYVGMGLCKQQEGNSAAASEFFDKARELDEDAVDFAETQRAKERKPQPKPRRPSKKTSRSKSPLDFNEAADPISGLK